MNNRVKENRLAMKELAKRIANVNSLEEANVHIGSILFDISTSLAVIADNMADAKPEDNRPCDKCKHQVWPDGDATCDACKYSYDSQFEEKKE